MFTNEFMTKNIDRKDERVSRDEFKHANRKKDDSPSRHKFWKTLFSKDVLDHKIALVVSYIQ